MDYIHIDVNKADYKNLAVLSPLNVVSKEIFLLEGPDINLIFCTQDACISF